MKILNLFVKKTVRQNIERFLAFMTLKFSKTTVIIVPSKR
jgi:hypothetical protein